MRTRLEPLGVGTLLLALLVAFVGEVVFFPVWSVGSGGVQMRILLGYVASDPAVFVLDRLVWAAAAIGMLAVGLIEAGRRDRPAGRRGWVTRERIALLFAIALDGAALLSFGWLARSGVDVLTFLGAVGILVAFGLSLYLFWTTRRLGSPARTLRVAAVACAVASACLAWWVGFAFESLAPDAWGTIAWVDVARWVLGETSLGLWLVAFSGILLRNRMAAPPTPAAF